LVRSLLPRDKILLEAAAGWLMLGNPGEAMREFEQVSAIGRYTQPALVTLWEIQAATKDWPAAAETGERLIAQFDQQPDGYIKRAFALHELKRSQDAWDTLYPMRERFPKNWLIHYNLACYAAQLGRATEAVQCFRRALKVGDERELQEMAMTDSDLAPIRPMIEKLAKR
jgi:tetratricopeptide (TPR) repeat protein